MCLVSPNSGFRGVCVFFSFFCGYSGYGGEWEKARQCSIWFSGQAKLVVGKGLMRDAVLWLEW